MKKRVKQGCRCGKGGKTSDHRKPSNPQVNGETLRSAVTWVVNGQCFQNLNFHGNTKWLVCDLIILAVLWVWSDHTTLTGAFVEAHGWSMKMLGRAAVGTYQGLTGVLVSATGTLLPLLWARMHGLMKRHGGEYWRIGGWRSMGRASARRERLPTGRRFVRRTMAAAPSSGRRNVGRTAWHNGRRSRSPSNRKSG